MFGFTLFTVEDSTVKAYYAQLDLKLRICGLFYLYRSNKSKFMKPNISVYFLYVLFSVFPVTVCKIISVCA